MPKKNASAVGLDRSPSLASPVASLLYKKKTSGMEIRRTPGVKLRFVGLRRFVRFNFFQVQLRFLVVMVQSYSFGHLYAVMVTTLFVSNKKIKHP